MDQVQNYKCPCCGGSLEYSGATNSLHCYACGNNYDVATMQQMNDMMNGAQAESKYNWGNYQPRQFDAVEAQSLSTYSCPSCGAQITGDGTMGSTVCPYCGNATIIQGTFEGSARPDFIIPFEVDKAKATKLFEADAMAKPFIPDEFKDMKRIQEMAGVYVPFWMFDCDCQAMITYNAENISHWSDSEYDYTKTDYFRLLRGGYIGFQNIPVDASIKADDAYMDALEPFDYTKAVNFNAGYLSGHLADKYDVSVEDSIGRANRRVENSAVEIFRDTTRNYQIVTPEFTNIQTAQGIVRYSLMPVWMLNIKFQGQNYQYAVNGQTGKVVGNYPIDEKKRKKHFRKTFIKWFIPLGIIASIIGYIMA